jgi:hypothetical protein
MEQGRVMGFQADVRAAAVELLTDYAANAYVRLQVYPARPRSIAPPTAFVDGIRESIEYVGMTLRQRRPVADVIVIHGIFDSKEAADQKDAFVDGFLDWVTTNYHAAGSNTLVAVTETEDLPNYVPEWMPPAAQLVYYATRLTMEGLALG